MHSPSTRRRLPGYVAIALFVPLVGGAAVPAGPNTPGPLPWQKSGTEQKGKKKPSKIDAALAKAFPDAKIERVACRLDPKQKKRVGDLAKQKAFAKDVTFAYIAREDGEIVGTAFFDSHVVRSKRETLLVAVSPAGLVQGVQTVVFKEPPEYIAQDSFYESLEERGQGRALMLGRGLDGTTGATLTCRAVADACRRVLALHETLGEEAGRVEPKPNPSEKDTGKKKGTDEGSKKKSDGGVPPSLPRPR